jgi:hypothetical protein
LQLPEPQQMGRLVDVAKPAEATVDPSTDLIASRSSKASGTPNTGGTRLAPYFESPSEFDELGNSKPRPAIEPPPPTPLPSPPTPSQESVSPAKVAVEPTVPTATPTSPSPAPSSPTVSTSAFEEARTLAAVARPESPTRQPEQPPTKPKEEPFQVAAAQGRAPDIPATQSADAPDPKRGETRGRAEGGVVKSMGFVGFEGMRHELAPFLQEVRDRVEKRWRALLELKYSGTSPTEAVLDCAIRADGTLVFVKIADAGNSASYAPLCQEAIQKAAPFPPFPFNVPEMYRNKDLEIRWTFSFL